MMEPGRLPYADGENHADQYIGEEEDMIDYQGVMTRQVMGVMGP